MGWNDPICRRLMATYLCATVPAACTGSGLGTRPVTASLSQASLATPGGQRLERRCDRFASSFDEAVACERADGTLRSFRARQIAWRVRYFVRYLAMPCGEAPTIEEAYVFHVVIDDLNNDADLTGAERAALRDAMFEGRIRCR